MLQKEKGCIFMPFPCREEKKKRGGGWYWKNFRPGIHKVMVWNEQQKLKHTTKPSVLILWRCTQINNCGHLSVLQVLFHVSSTAELKILKIILFFLKTFTCDSCSTPGAKRIKDSVICLFNTMLVMQSRGIRESCTLTLVIDNWW